MQTLNAESNKPCSLCKHLPDDPIYVGKFCMECGWGLPEDQTWADLKKAALSWAALITRNPVKECADPIELLNAELKFKAAALKFNEEYRSTDPIKN